MITPALDAGGPSRFAAGDEVYGNDSKLRTTKNYELDYEVVTRLAMFGGPCDERRHMTDPICDRDAAVGGFVAPRGLREYAGRYAEHFALSRAEGVLEIRRHTSEAPRVSPANGW